jgi:hypothetical protein
MKNVKLFIAIVCLFMVALVNAQQIEHEGKEYRVKGEKIFLNDVDVTADLSADEQLVIKNKLKNKIATEKRLKSAEKAQKQAENKQKKAEKKQKQAEKALKRSEKAQKNYENAMEKYSDAQKKYEKLKNKGKLSPVDEEKWLKKLENLKENVEKNRKRANRT